MTSLRGRVLRVSLHNHELFVESQNADDGTWDHYRSIDVSFEALKAFFVQEAPWKVLVGTIEEYAPNDALSLRSHVTDMILRAFESAWKDVDVAKILVHPAVMREKVEEIQRESERFSGQHAASFLRRRLGLENGSIEDALTSYYESEFRLRRAKDIEDSLIAGRSEEAERDLNTIVEDSRVWARWMIDAHLFPVRKFDEQQ